MSITNYRILVISTFFVLIFSLTIDFFWLKDLLNFVADFAASLLDVSELRHYLFLTFFILMLLTAAYSLIGLLRFKKRARYVFLIMFVFIIPIYLLLGVSVQSGLSRIFYDVGLLMSGVVLASIYSNPLKTYFTD